MNSNPNTMQQDRRRILFVITKSNFGGAQRYVYELAVGLPKETFDVAVAFGGNGVLKEKLEASAVRTYSIVSFARDINLIKEFRAFFELGALIRKERPDVIHLNSSKVGLLGALVARIHRVPHVIFTVHGWPFFEVRNPLWRLCVWFFSWITALLAHTIILVSAHDRERAHMPFVQHKYKLIRTGVPQIPFKERVDARKELLGEEVYDAHADDLWLVSTGEFTKNKNLLTLLEAARKIREQDHDVRYFFTLIGEGEDRNMLESYVAEHGLETMVTFTGYVDDARSYLKAFDLYALPSHKEGFPYGLLEACSAGIPVIASNVGGIPEVIAHNETGILIDPHSVDTLVDALTFARSERERVAGYAQKLIDTTLHDFSLDRMRSDTYELYFIRL